MKQVTAAEVALAGRELPALPFALPIRHGDQDEQVVCREVFRLLPGRRLVARGDWRGEDVVLKLFLGPRAGRDRDRECRGLQLLAEAGARVPRQRLRLAAGEACGLLLEHVPAGTPPGVLYGEAMSRVVRLFAALHQHGILQRDPHPGNFIGADDLVALDGGGVCQRSAPLNPRRSLDNLGQLLAQRPPAADADVATLAAEYAAARGWSAAADWQHTVDAALQRQRHRRITRYLRKTCRDCTEFAVSRSWRHSALKLRGWAPAEWRALLESPDAVVAGGELLKNGNSATVVRWRPSSGRPLVIKRYNIKDPLHGIRRNLRPRARYRNAWRNGQCLRLLDIPTATPLALVEQRAGPWRGVAYLITQDLGGVDLAGEIAGQGLSDARAAEVAQLLVTLRRAGFTHGDTKASNFMIFGDRVHLIDLDAMVHDGWSTGSSEDDLSRFLRNWTPAVRARFEEHFVAAGLL